MFRCSAARRAQKRLRISAFLATTLRESKSIPDAHDLFQDTYTELYAVLKRRGTDYIKNSEAFVMRLARQKLSRYYSLYDRLKAIRSLFVETEDGEEVNLADLEEQSVSFEEVDTALLRRIFKRGHKRCPVVFRPFAGGISGYRAFGGKVTAESIFL